MIETVSFEGAPMPGGYCEFLSNELSKSGEHYCMLGDCQGRFVCLYVSGNEIPQEGCDIANNEGAPFRGLTSKGLTSLAMAGGVV